jgi:hypothetical protein
MYSFLDSHQKHSTTVGLFLNPRTRNITPQYHVIYDDLFMTVPKAKTGGLLNPNDFDANSWRRLVELGAEHYVFNDEDKNGMPVPLPELDEEWMSEQKRER